MDRQRHGKKVNEIKAFIERIPLYTCFVAYICTLVYIQSIFNDGFFYVRDHASNSIIRRPRYDSELGQTHEYEISLRVTLK